MRWTEQQLADHKAKRPVAPSAGVLDVSLDLPVPPSVNRTRKINWETHRKVKAWQAVADGCVLAAKTRADNPLRLLAIRRFELFVTLDEKLARLDLDNSLKALIDYIRHIGLVEDDSKKHMRRITVEWGDVPAGCRITVRPT